MKLTADQIIAMALLAIIAIAVLRLYLRARASDNTPRPGESLFDDDL